jgi:hypothetical protein
MFVCLFLSLLNVAYWIRWRINVKGKHVAVIAWVKALCSCLCLEEAARWELHWVRQPEDRDLTNMKVKCSSNHSNIRWQHSKYNMKQANILIKYANKRQCIIWVNRTERTKDVWKIYKSSHVSAGWPTEVSLRAGAGICLADARSRPSLPKTQSLFNGHAEVKRPKR